VFEVIKREGVIWVVDLRDGWVGWFGSRPGCGVGLIDLRWGLFGLGY